MNRKPIFDAIDARLPGVWNVPGNIARMNAALDALVAPTSTGAMHIGRDGVELIQRFEGCAKLRSDGRYEAYPDPGTGGDPWTIGWGTTGADIGRGLVWTRQQCDDRLIYDLKQFEQEVSRALTAPTTQAQFDALVSFHYNTGAIAKATLTKRHNAGDYAGAAAEFARWVNAGGRPMAGLKRRREAEAQLYRSGS